VQGLKKKEERIEKRVSELDKDFKKLDALVKSKLSGPKSLSGTTKRSTLLTFLWAPWTKEAKAMY
jgi:hypothetical protein